MNKTKKTKKDNKKKDKKTQANKQLNEIEVTDKGQTYSSISLGNFKPVLL